MLQIKPNHAEHLSHFSEKFLNEMFRTEVVVAQRKYDGERMLIHFENGKTYCTSRTVGKNGLFSQNEDKILYLPKLEGLEYTVIDCECFAKNWSEVVGVLHSLPERAIDLQKKGVMLQFAVFDCLFFNGEDLRDVPYVGRLFYIQQIIEKINLPTLFKVESQQINSKEEIIEFMNESLEEGFEGCVIKSFAKTYYEKGATLKCKKFETVDCIVCGYQKGNGKYKNTIGALEIGYYNEETNSIIPISKVNCGTDEERNLWNINKEQWLNTVIEVKCQEITEKSLRHPVYIRRREDKDYKRCTKDTIFFNKTPL